MTGLAHAFLVGASAMGYAISSLFFARFWSETRDRLFWLFSLAFLMLAVNRVLVLLSSAVESRVEIYLVRLAAFLLIASAVVDKNRRGRAR